MNPLVSVYLPTHHRADLLKRSVYSVLAQTYRNIELIVVIDGDNPESEIFLSSLETNITIQVITNKQSTGASHSRNQAISAANGEFVTGLDDDDWFSPNRIESFVNAWTKLVKQNTQFSALFDSMICIRNDSPTLIHRQSHVDSCQIRSGNAIGGFIFTTRDIYIGAGLYDVCMPAWQDWDLWVRVISRYGKAININQATYLVDERHHYPRITTSDPKTINKAYLLFMEKHNIVTGTEKAAIIEMYSRYPQVQLSQQEISTLFLNGKIRTAIKLIISSLRFFHKSGQQ